MKKLFILVLITLLTSCSQSKTRFEAVYTDYFDTLITVNVYLENQQQFEQFKGDFEREAERLHKMFDIYNDYDSLNNIKAINDNAGVRAVGVSPEIIELLLFCKEQYDFSSGRLNVAMGSVLKLWHEARSDALTEPNKAFAPSVEELFSAADHCDINNVIINSEKNTVFLSDNLLSLDVGAVAKGFAAQKISQLLEIKYRDFLLNMGGNIVAKGKKPDGSAWQIGIQNPDASSDKPYVKTLALQDLAAVTSGDYQRYFEINGVKYHHIIDPKTLFPAEHFSSVTVVCDSSALADSLSTAIFCMNEPQAAEFIAKLKAVDVYIYDKNNNELFLS